MYLLNLRILLVLKKIQAVNKNAEAILRNPKKTKQKKTSEKKKAESDFGFASFFINEFFKMMKIAWTSEEPKKT